MRKSEVGDLEALIDVMVEIRDAIKLIAERLDGAYGPCPSKLENVPCELMLDHNGPHRGTHFRNDPTTGVSRASSVYWSGAQGSEGNNG